MTEAEKTSARKRMYELLQEGKSPYEIAEETGIGITTVAKLAQSLQQGKRPAQPAPVTDEGIGRAVECLQMDMDAAEREIKQQRETIVLLQGQVNRLAGIAESYGESIAIIQRSLDKVVTRAYSSRPSKREKELETQLRDALGSRDLYRDSLLSKEGNHDKT